MTNLTSSLTLGGRIVVLLSLTILSAPLVAQVTSGSIDVGGGSLPYVIEGSGQPCIFAGIAIYYRRAIPPEIKKHFRFIFVDTRIVAPDFASDTTSPYPTSVAVDDIERVRAALGIDSAFIFGHSVWGLLALEYTRKYPERVIGVIVVGSPARWGAGFEEITDSFWQQDASPERKAVHKQRVDTFGPQVSKLKGSDRLIARYVMSAAHYWYDPHFDSAPFWKDVHLNMSLLGSFFQSFGVYDVRHGAPIQRPIFLALGRYDYSVPHTVWEPDIRKSFSNLTYTLFEKSGHTPFYEEGDRFEHELVTWLKTIGGGR